VNDGAKMDGNASSRLSLMQVSATGLVLVWVTGPSHHVFFAAACYAPHRMEYGLYDEAGSR